MSWSDLLEERRLERANCSQTDFLDLREAAATKFTSKRRRSCTVLEKGLSVVINCILMRKWFLSFL
jgi:hypothetical protein